ARLRAGRAARPVRGARGPSHSGRRGPAQPAARAARGGPGPSGAGRRPHTSEGAAPPVTTPSHGDDDRVARIHEALNGVMDPEIHRPRPELGMIDSVE